MAGCSWTRGLHKSLNSLLASAFACVYRMRMDAVRGFKCTCQLFMGITLIYTLLSSSSPAEDPLKATVLCSHSFAFSFSPSFR